LWQEPGERLGTVVAALAASGLRQHRPMGMFHVLNPYKPRRPGEDAVHGRSLESIATARKASDGVAVVAVVEPGHKVPQSAFDDTVLLPPSSTDHAPKLFDVLTAACDSSAPGEYVVFTNMDICVTPSFYHGVGTLLGLGAEALIINRRTVHRWDPTTDESVLAEYDLGENHPGLDCFAFPRAWVDEFAVSDAVIGHGYVMRGLLYNLVARADPLVVLTEVGMTYHYGDDRPWQMDEAAPWFARNRNAAAAVYSKLAADPDASARLDAFVSALPKYSPRPG